MGQSPFVSSIQRVAAGDGVLVAPQRAIKFGPGFVVVDVPAEVLNDADGSGQVTGATEVTLEGGGTSFAFIEDEAADPVATTGFLRMGEGPTDIIEARATAGAGDRALVSWEDGALVVGGGATTTEVAGTDSVSLSLDGSTLLELGTEPSLADALSVFLGTKGNLGVIFPAGVEQVEILRLPRADAGNAYSTTITGQSATDGDGADVAIWAGGKAGTGVNDGEVVIGSGDAKECFRATQGIAQLGDPTNNSTASVKFVTHNQTTVGAAGIASALPGAPEGYIRVYVDGTERLIPYWPIP